jgi:hypothetical protein
MRMRKVTCVSPHGGCHHGMRADNSLPAHPGYGGRLALDANEDGWVTSAVLGHVAVGSTVDAPDAPEFIADGFHFVNEAGTADACAAAGDDCWCGVHRGGQPDAPPDAATVPPFPSVPSTEGM